MIEEESGRQGEIIQGLADCLKLFNVILKAVENLAKF